MLQFTQARPLQAKLREARVAGRLAIRELIQAHVIQYPQFVYVVLI